MLFLEGLLSAIIAKAHYLTGVFFTITTGYNGYILTRLNGLDKLDNLKDVDADKIRSKAAKIRKLLDKIIPFSIYCAGILLLSSLTADSVPNAHIFIGIFSSFTIAIGVLLLNIMTHANRQIAELLNKVNNLSRIEEKRQALLSEMWKDAESEPFSHMDFKLESYKNVIKP